MNNCVEHFLPELELATFQVREAMQCILHTIIFLRAPGPVAPREVPCEGFNLTYAKIGIAGSTISIPPKQPSKGGVDRFSNQTDSVDAKIDESIERFLRRLTQIGPELLSGCLTLSFYERRTKRHGLLFGLMTQEEKVVWEQWNIRVVVNNTPRPVNDDSASVIERQRIQVSSYF